MDVTKELEDAVNELRREDLIELVEELKQVAGAHRVKVGPKDVIVLRHPGNLSDQAYERISTLFAEELKESGYGHDRALILEEGMSMVVLGFGDEED